MLFRLHPQPILKMPASFSIPGLMPPDSPKYAGHQPPFVLHTHRAGDTLWEGIDPIGPIVFDDGEGNTTSPPASAVRLVMEFVPRMYAGRQCVVFDNLDSADGLTEIVSGSSWQFRVPVQPLPLAPGYWDWILYVVDERDVRTDLYAGEILITP